MPSEKGDPQIELDSKVAGLDARLIQQEKNIARLSEEIAVILPAIPSQVIAERVRSILRSVELRFSFGGPLETATAAREKLEDMAEAADMLHTSIERLGPGALEVLNHGIENYPPSSEDLQLRLMADAHEVGAGLWPVDLTDECIDTWRQGGIWSIRLKALARLARRRSSRLEESIAEGHHHGLTEKLRGSLQEEMFYQCAEALAHWLVAPETQRLSTREELYFDVELFRRLLMRLGQGIQEMIQGEPLKVKKSMTREPKRPQKSQWGRVAARKAEVRLFGKPLKTRPLKNNR
jgi:hypothetical protein